MSLPPMNQVMSSFEIVGLMRGEEKANGDKNIIDITAVVFLDVRLKPNGLCRPQKTE